MKDNFVIISQCGMVNIDGPGIAYSNVRGLYTDGHGHGLQLDKEYKRKEILDICNEIADQVYALTVIMNKKVRYDRS